MKTLAALCLLLTGCVTTSTKVTAPDGTITETRISAADAGTIRADFADSIDANAVHGSDAIETAKEEIAFFFAGLNVYSR